MVNDRIHTIWHPIMGSTARQLIAESALPFRLAVNYGPDDTEDVSSLHDGLLHFVCVDVPVGARVEVREVCSALVASDEESKRLVVAGMHREPETLHAADVSFLALNASAEHLEPVDWPQVRMDMETAPLVLAAARTDARGQIADEVLACSAEEGEARTFLVS